MSRPVRAAAAVPRPDEVAGAFPALAPVEAVEPLAGDGSARRFFRVWARPGPVVLLEGPDPGENAAYVRLARHLEARGVRVPRVLGVHEPGGWVLLEDLGDQSLWGAARQAPPGGLVPLYGPVLRLLARLQVLGARGYDPALGLVREPYGPRVMVEEEGLYFVRELLRGVLGLEAPAGLRADLERLAGLGAAAPAGYLLHRDFQSRNILLTPGGPAVIDFQSARPGPLAYDAAALILDPYVGLPAWVRGELLARYLGELSALGEEPGGFDDAWFALGAFRLLQALGAFGKLGGRMGKPGFLEHAGTALDQLAHHLGERGRRELPALWEAVARARGAWRALGARTGPTTGG